MDAVISIGGQSLVDGLLRILSPALQALRSPLPVPLPAVSNAVLSIRSIESVFPSARAGTLELRLEIDLTGEALIAASVVNQTLTLTFPNAPQPNPASFTLPQLTGTGTGIATLTLGPAGGTTINIQLPAGTATLPLPAVVPFPLNFTAEQPIVARVFLTPLVNQGAIGTEAPINATSGFGLEFDFPDPTVQVDLVAAANISATQTVITTAVTAITAQLLPGLSTLTQSAAAISTMATNIATAIPAAVQTILGDAFGGLRTRTGRLIFPAPAAGSSCDVLALPTDGKAQIVISGGSLVLQIGLDRLPISPPSPFPTFTPTATVDTGITLANAFVLSLLACLVEKFPNLSISAPPILAIGAPPLTATWPLATLAVGPLAFTGPLTLTIAGVPGAAGQPVPKTITLAFAAAATFGAPFVIGPALFAAVTATITIAFDLNSLASITGLRPAAPIATTFSLGLGAGLIALFVIAAAAILLPAFAVPFPIVWPGFAAIAFLLIALPFVINGILSGLLGTAVTQLLGGAQRLLESPVALPPAIFEAFGELVPTTVVLDDLDAGGVLRTPTSPWAVLPLLPRRG